MCEHCEKGRIMPAIRARDDIDLCVAGSALIACVSYALFGDGETIEVEYDINYCPMCGRDLGGDVS